MGSDGRLDSSHGRSSSSGSGSMQWPAPERSSSRGYAGQSGSPTGSGPNSASAGPGSEGNFSFPTLTSPFFPTPSQMFNSGSSSSSAAGGAGGGAGGTGSSSGSASGGGGVFGSNQLPPPQGGLNTSNSRNGYDHRSYAPSPPPLGGASFAQSASRHGLGLAGLGNGNNGLPRSLPPVQSIPGYSSGLGGPGAGSAPQSEMGEIWTRGT